MSKPKESSMLYMRRYSVVKRLSASERAKLRMRFVEGAGLKENKKKTKSEYRPKVNILLNLPEDLVMALDEIASLEGNNKRTKVIERLLQEGVEAFHSRS